LQRPLEHCALRLQDEPVACPGWQEPPPTPSHQKPGTQSASPVGLFGPQEALQAVWPALQVR
jgi:hypothetical protein